MMRLRMACFLAVALVVSGCGGGGGTTTTPPPAAPTVTSVTPASAATSVAVNATISATFSLAMNASSITASTFTVTPQGGSAVAGAYSVSGTIATFTPAASLAYNTQYTATITTGASDSAGTALAANYSWTFTTASAPVAPTITAVTPLSAATNVAINTTVTATFSQAMNASTITSSTFTLTGPGDSAVAGTVAYTATGSIATFTPSASLAYNTLYTATITTGAVDSAGVALAASFSWAFTTAAAPAAPTVTAVTPSGGATNVSVTAPVITATFSQAMNAATITSSTFTLTGPGNTAVAGTVAYTATGSIATFTPSANLAYGTQYTATITTGVTSASGVALATSTSWSFTTAAAPVPPTVTAVTPANAATNVPVAAPVITATFSEAMNASTITAATFTLTPQGGASVAGTVSYTAAGSVATFTPSANLATNTLYTAAITTGVTNSSGIALAANYSWTFTTAQPPAPTVVATTPAKNATGVSLSAALTATFSVAMNATTITTSTFTLAGPGSTAVAGAVTYSAGTGVATFTPSAALTAGTTYTATVTTGAMSAAGAALAANYVWTFTTAANPNQVTVDFGASDQVIRGFGGSTAWLGQMPQAVATGLFDPSKGLGLSILRLRIDPEGSSTGGGAKGDPYETGEWDYEAANGLEAVTANPNAIVFASPWTPPAAWKLNGSSSVVDDGETWNQSFNSCAEGTGYCGGYLDPNHYADYANYLEDFVKFFNTTNGFDLYAISMQNEPEENVTYESCVWTPEEMDTWVANNASTITSDASATKLIMPESDTFNPVDAAKALGDTNAEGRISIIGGHLYGVSPAPYSIPGGDSAKEIWMTEFGPLSSATLTWAQALTTYGESIHNSMVTGQYNAYVWWGLFGATTGSCATSAGTCGLVDDAGNVLPMGEVMGQYSKFIQPGYSRFDATANPSSNVYVSAYAGMESTQQHYVIVAINAGTSAVSQSFTIDNATVTSMTPWQSTSAAGLVQQTAVTVTGNSFTYSLPAQSITTFVQ
jgi:O-glycosyl hydrolase